MRGAPSAAKRSASAGGADEAEVEPREQRLDGVGQIAPALERALGQPAVDDDQRNAALRRAHDHVGPQVGFDEQGEIGPPVVEELGHEGGAVERHELVDRAGRQALLGERRRRHRAGGDQDVVARRRAAARSAGSRRRARRRSRRAPRPEYRAAAARVGFAAPLGEPLGVLLAALQAAPEHLRRERRRRGRQQRVGAQRQRQAIRQWSPQGALLRSDDRRARRRARWPG